MTKLSVRESTTAEELEKIIGLRYQVLRQPWGQPYETSKDDLEDQSVNAYIADSDKRVIACGRLQKNTQEIAQVRYMAVAPEHRGKGLGAAILSYLEQRSREWKVKTLQLQARENALAFYESQGYTIVEKSFLLWGQVQHYLMEKRL